MRCEENCEAKSMVGKGMCGAWPVWFGVMRLWCVPSLYQPGNTGKGLYLEVQDSP